ncbi:hypothetical protein SCLCIDRAFT_1172515, partial [Scleroderma citrinum Foug A]
QVVNSDNVPSTVSKEHPIGKKATFYCVLFFPAGDYTWLVSKDISKLKDHKFRHTSVSCTRRMLTSLQ